MERRFLSSDVSIANLRYLSSTQALADLDAFIKGMKEEYEIPDAKVVVFGGSYPGRKPFRGGFPLRVGFHAPSFGSPCRSGMKPLFPL